ncbi:MerR family DNA-binding transcriptional regulator [Saccharopolyspora pogona]|uniref:MerR family DNA-binding transcriptional regulator n=1 Tax=Saccharopolyspora pogona TaxID=333966 RepID=UPI001683ED5E
MTDRLVPTTIAARMLGVSTRTLRRYTQQGVLPDRRSAGGRRVFSVAELEDVRRRRGPVPPAEGVVLYARVPSQRQRAVRPGRPPRPRRPPRSTGRRLADAGSPQRLARSRPASVAGDHRECFWVLWHPKTLTGVLPPPEAVGR